jgi:hypothetical protein
MEMPDSPASYSWLGTLHSVILNSRYKLRGFPTEGPDMAELHRRAHRFAIKTRICYREVGGMSWSDGTTENISRSGVLFNTDHALDLKAAVQMCFSLPVSTCDDGSGQIYCRGSVVRTAPTADPNVTAIAASIRSYRLVRGHRQT